MKTTPRIKICGITRVEDGLACARLGADAIGLVFYPKSPRAVSIAQAQKIVAALPPFVTTVALFANPSLAEVEAVLRAVRPDLLQFHGDETADFCRQFGVRYLKALPVRAGADLLQSAAAYPDAAGLLLDTPTEAFGGCGVSFDWSLIPAEMAARCVLAGGLNAANVAAAIRQVRPWAVDVSSGVEMTAPLPAMQASPRGGALSALGGAGGVEVIKGIKDAVKIAAFIKEVRNADL